MAVYKRSYRAYSGKTTPAWSRFFILSRYALRGLFASKFLTALFVMCFFGPLICALGIYLNHNNSVLMLLHARKNELLDVNGKFFLGFLGMQGGLAFFITAFIGPGTIAPDLANGALPLYFCRPFSRVEYVLGKFGALLYLLSLITWLPGLALFFMEANLSGAAWLRENWTDAAAIVITSLMYITLISLIAMALSAWVKWKIAAGALLLGVMFFLSGFGAAMNAVLRSHIGYYLSPGVLLTRVCAGLFRVEPPLEVSLLGAWIGLLIMCGICVALLGKKVRAYEVIR